MSTAGCDEGQLAPAGGQVTVILAFLSQEQENGTFGVVNGASNLFVSDSYVADLATAYASGFACATAAQNAGLQLIIGTNNQLGVTYTLGQDWATLVSQIQSDVNGLGLGSRISVMGGSDIETQWADPKDTRAWADGFNSVTYAAWDYGNAEGCPTSGSDGATYPARCANGWTQEDVWYVAANNGDGAIPQIYDDASTDSLQWQQIAAYSRSVHGWFPRFSIILTQQRACLQTLACVDVGPPTVRYDNSPQTAMSQFQSVLTNDPVTQRNFQTPWVLTDIEYDSKPEMDRSSLVQSFVPCPSCT
jgi:hypothetical protein